MSKYLYCLVPAECDGNVKSVCEALVVFDGLSISVFWRKLFPSLLPVCEKLYRHFIFPECKRIQWVEEDPRGLTIGEPPKNIRNLIW